MKVTIHLPNGLPAEAYLDDLRREFPDAEAFVGLSTDGDALDKVHAAYPNADILVRFYAADRMGHTGREQAAIDFMSFALNHRWARHFVPMNEANLQGEHGGSSAPWNDGPAYALIDVWLREWAAEFRRQWGANILPGAPTLHWPALSPQPDELEHLHLCAESLFLYDVVDLHTYVRFPLDERLDHYSSLTGLKRYWVSECNQGQEGHMVDFMRWFRSAASPPTNWFRGVEVTAWFIYDSADPAFDWCKIRGKPEALLWMTIAREAKDWPTTPTPQPPPGGGNMLKDQYPDVYQGWLDEQGGTEAVLAGLFEDHGVGIGLRSATLADLLRLAERQSSVSNQLTNAVRRLPKAP